LGRDILQFLSIFSLILTLRVETGPFQSEDLLGTSYLWNWAKWPAFL